MDPDFPLLSWTVGDASGTAGMQKVLRNHFLGLYRMKLCTKPTAEFMQETKVRVVDGNHCMTALKRAFSEEDMFFMRFYCDFDNPAQES